MVSSFFSKHLISTTIGWKDFKKKTILPFMRVVKDFMQISVKEYSCIRRRVVTSLECIWSIHINPSPSSSILFARETSGKLLVCILSSIQPELLSHCPLLAIWHRQYQHHDDFLPSRPALQIFNQLKGTRRKRYRCRQPLCQFILGFGVGPCIEDENGLFPTKREHFRHPDICNILSSCVFVKSLFY